MDVPDRFMAARRASLALLDLLVSCGRDEASRSGAPPAAAPAIDAAAPSPPPAPVHPLVAAITDPALLTELEDGNDYVCARIGEEADGASVPAYFLFQLRVDGHPSPR